MYWSVEEQNNSTVRSITSCSTFYSNNTQDVLEEEKIDIRVGDNYIKYNPAVVTLIIN